ncbi:hypothetical protein [Kutzneria kofuensis]|uniref:DUF4232 domain-containing protein n=1 Tax=Kutzneria kofuensis TaxID=103725 RepID=A0A7W9NFC1_9PSEU|nr:hypothetical protein [Kutzneria kofuensis]MBB5889971.1 hypothetical protein [Kutzneria kofuensis]
MKKLALLALVAGAALSAAPAAAVTAPPVPCGADIVSFYFGGFSQNLSLGTFDLTLLAHDGVACTLPDTPLVTVSGPGADIPVHVDGRGGTLVLRPDSPLHAQIAYHRPDLPENAVPVSTLRLAMPDKSFRGTYFGTPGAFDIQKDGVLVSAWRTGLGLGQGEGTS